jgi:hypothetical protein
MSRSSAEEPSMYVPTMAVFLNRWFTSYEEARAARDADLGYLFPYRNQFFVTAADAIRELGLDPADPDWELIGWDWVHPRDPDAWERLRVKREIAG